MGKASKWLKGLLTGKKENEKDRITSHPPPRETRSAPTLLPVPKEKRRWSFRRPAAGAGKDLSSPDPLAFPESDMDQKRHAMAVAVATAAAADAAVAAAQAAAAVVRLTTTTSAAASPRTTAVDVAAAIRIQAVFRSYLARKALRALKGLVKLQALARGHLVRKQATATLRCMQALVTVQARARAQRIRTLGEPQPSPQRPLAHRRSPQHSRFRQSYDMERSVDEGVKIVEMDLGYSIAQDERMDHRFSTYSGSRSHSRLDPYQQVSPAPSALTDMSLGACSGHFEDFSFNTAQSSPHYFSATSMPDATKADFIASRHEGAYPMSSDYPFIPNYMAKTESSRAKARSQSAPKQRPDSSERPPSRRRPSLEGRNIPRSVRMQRSSSLVGASVNEYQYPWSIKLDKSNMSIKDSECGSTSTVLTNTNYSRSLVSIEVHRK